MLLNSLILGFIHNWKGHKLLMDFQERFKGRSNLIKRDGPLQLLSQEATPIEKKQDSPPSNKSHEKKKLRNHTKFFALKNSTTFY